MKKFVITDIHGCKKTFEALLDSIQFSTEDELYLLGDYIDRGPDSKGVIDFIWKLQQESYKVHCLRGNHEQLLIDGQHSSNDLRVWKANGGYETIASFGVKDAQNIPDQYLDFIESLPYFFEVDEYLLVHAGLNFKTPDPLEDHDALIWIRNWYSDIDLNWLGERIVIHGHTPSTKPQVKIWFENIATNQFLNLDSGCVYKNRRPGYGFLAAFEMTNRKLYFKENIDFL